MRIQWDGLKAAPDSRRYNPSFFEGSAATCDIYNALPNEMTQEMT
jgi:hypothetical protein